MDFDPELDRLLNEGERRAIRGYNTHSDDKGNHWLTPQTMEERSLGMEYDTSMDPISPNFNPDSWVGDKNPRNIMELFLDITKETIIGDVIVVPEHRADIHDTQAQMASQFMHAYNIDSLKCHVYNGMTITFRKVSDD
jgi:hypothetical protein